MFETMWEKIRNYAESIYVCAQNPIFLFLFLSFVINVMIVMFTDTETLTHNTVLHLSVIVGPPFVLMLYYLWTHSHSYGTIVMAVIGFGVLAVITYELYKVSSSPYFAFAGAGITYLFLFVGLVVLHAIILVIMEDYIVAQTGWFGFALDVLFFIPCMIRDLIVVIMGELANTSRTLYILLILEILLVLGYVYFPMIWEWLTRPLGSISILQGGVYLNTPQTISNHVTPWMDKTQPNGPHFRNKYGISFWINVTNHSPNVQGYDTPKMVFDFGNGKPTLKWNPNNIEKPRTNDDYRVKTTDIGEFELILGENVPPVPLSLEILPFQKWNCLFFQYDEKNQVDVFVNGKLVHHTTLDTLPVFTTSTSMIVGDKHGLQGVIAGVNYYITHISTFEIQSIPFPTLSI